MWRRVTYTHPSTLHQLRPKTLRSATQGCALDAMCRSWQAGVWQALSPISHAFQKKRGPDVSL